ISRTSHVESATSPASTSAKNTVPRISISQSRVDRPCVIGRGSSSTRICQPTASRSTRIARPIPSASGIPTERRTMRGPPRREGIESAREGGSRVLRSRCSRVLPSLAALVIGSVTASGFAGELPPEHACPAFGEPSPGSTAERVAEGMVLARADLLRLSALLPPEVWRHRDAFFHEEMRMAIGACHRRYPVPSAYRLATERFAGRARLDADGNLTGYTAGLPFPPETIDGAGSDAGARWAWNAELRNRGAGPSARFRITEWAGAGDEEISQGSWFQHLIAHRADLALPAP